jgi:hypothetical protein
MGMNKHRARKSRAYAAGARDALDMSKNPNEKEDHRLAVLETCQTELP